MRKLAPLLVLLLAIALVPRAEVTAATSPTEPPAPPGMVLCDLESGAPLSAGCQAAEYRALHHAQVRPQSGTYYGCANSGLPLKAIAYNYNQYVDSQLDLYKTTGYMCYYYFGTDHGNNDFDFDDYWYVGLRTWICGRFNTTYQDTGTGPEAQADTPVLYYGSCGPQADNNGSWVYIDYVAETIPYVRF